MGERSHGFGVLGVFVLLGCGAGAPASRAAPAPCAASSPAVPGAGALLTPSPPQAAFEMPKDFGPQRWLALGPLPALSGERAHASLDHDYLGTLGGEASVHIDASSKLQLEGQTLSARSVEARAGIVDFAALYGGTPDTHVTDNRVAYAYAELEAPQASTALALFGSDDGAAVWLNGKRVHRMAADRAVDPDSDHFELPLSAGKNRILVKVDNGSGGWVFALRLFDVDARRKLEVLEARKHLEQLGLGPATDEFLL